MKKLLLILSLFINYSHQPSREYLVSFVSPGELIRFKATGKPVKVKDKLRPEDQLVFNDKKAKLEVMDLQAGSFYVTWHGFPKRVTRIAELKELIMPSPKPMNYDVRSLDCKGYDPADYFDARETDNKMLVIIGQPLLIKSSYLMDNQHFFFIQYKKENDILTKRILTSGRKLIFETQTFSDNAEDYAICYQSVDLHGKPYSDVLAHFVPVLVSAEQIQSETNVIRKCSEMVPDSIGRNLLLNHFNRNYGKVGLCYLSQ